MATTGFGVRRIWIWRSSTLRRPTPDSSTYPSSPRTRWSPPEQKASGPSPVKMITPTSGSSRATSKALAELDQRPGPKGVAHLGPTDRDLGHALGRFVPNVLVVPGASSKPGSRVAHRPMTPRVITRIMVGTVAGCPTASSPWTHRGTAPCSCGVCGSRGTQETRWRLSTRASPVPPWTAFSPACGPAVFVDGEGATSPPRRRPSGRAG